MDNESFDEFDLNNEEYFFTSHQTRLYLGALDLAESYYSSQNSEASTRKKKIQNSILTGKA